MHKTPEIIKILAQARQSASIADDLKGRVIGSNWGIVTVNDDPENLRRIKCKFPETPGLDSYWIMRSPTSHNLDEPVPLIGQTVLVEFVHGDVTKGFYRVIQNKVNPAHETADPLIDHSHKIEGSKYVEVGKNGEISYGENLTVTVGDETLIAGDDTITIKSNGTAIIEINPDGTIKLIAPQKLTIATPSIAFENETGGATSLTINASTVQFVNTNSLSVNGKQLASIGAVDSDGDTIQNKGW